MANVHAKLLVFREMEMVATDATWLTAMAVAMDSHHRISVFRRHDMLPTSKTSQEMARQPQWWIEIRQISCRPSNFTSRRSWLMLRIWRRHLELAQTAHSWRHKHCRWWPGNPKDRLKIRNYSNLRLRDQARSLEKHLSARMLPLWCHCTMFFFFLSLITAFVLIYEK